MKEVSSFRDYIQAREEAGLEGIVDKRGWKWSDDRVIPVIHQSERCTKLLTALAAARFRLAKELLAADPNSRPYYTDPRYRFHTP